MGVPGGTQVVGGGTALTQRLHGELGQVRLSQLRTEEKRDGEDGPKPLLPVELGNERP